MGFQKKEKVIKFPFFSMKKSVILIWSSCLYLSWYYNLVIKSDRDNSDHLLYNLIKNLTISFIISSVLRGLDLKSKFPYS